MWKNISVKCEDAYSYNQHTVLKPEPNKQATLEIKIHATCNITRLI